MAASSAIITFLAFGLGVFFMSTTTTTTAFPNTSIEEDFFDANNTCIVNVTNPNCTKCAKGSYAPYPDDPAMFYQCDNGEFYPMHCINNTLWNQTLHTCVHDETITTNTYDSHSNPTNMTTYTPVSSTTTKQTTTKPTTMKPTTMKPTTTTPTQGFDGASFGGGIGAGIGIALVVLLLIRCCCYSPSRDGYEQHL